MTQNNFHRLDLNGVTNCFILLKYTGYPGQRRIFFTGVILLGNRKQEAVDQWWIDREVQFRSIATSGEVLCGIRERSECGRIRNISNYNDISGGDR